MPDENAEKSETRFTTVPAALIFTSLSNPGFEGRLTGGAIKSINGKSLEDAGLEAPTSGSVVVPDDPVDEPDELFPDDEPPEEEVALLGVVVVLPEVFVLLGVVVVLPEVLELLGVVVVLPEVLELLGVVVVLPEVVSVLSEVLSVSDPSVSLPLPLMPSTGLFSCPAHSDSTINSLKPPLSHALKVKRISSAGTNFLIGRGVIFSI